jgi:hypothetical protein
VGDGPKPEHDTFCRDLSYSAEIRSFPRSLLLEVILFDDPLPMLLGNHISRAHLGA